MDAHPLSTALEDVETSIISAMPGLIDDLLDSAALAIPGTDAAERGAALLEAAEQLKALSALVERVGRSTRIPPQAAPTRRRMSA